MYEKTNRKSNKYPWHIHVNKSKKAQKGRQKTNYGLIKNVSHAKSLEQHKIILAYQSIWKRINSEKLLIPSGGKTMIENIKAMLLRDQIMYAYANGGTITIKNLWEEFMGMPREKTPEDKELLMKGAKAYKYLIKQANTDFWLEHENDNLDKLFKDIYDSMKVIGD